MKLNPVGRQTIIITGGIASGKSYVRTYMQKLGYDVFDSDAAVRELMLPGSSAYDRLAVLVPSAIGSEGFIDRTALSDAVLSGQLLLEQLEQLLHPLLHTYRLRWLDDAHRRSDRSVLIETPLFFEKKLEIPHDSVLCTICPVEIQHKRAMKRLGMTEDKFSIIINNQVDNERRIRGSDLLIDAGGTKEDTKKQIDALHKRDD